MSIFLDTDPQSLTQGLYCVRDGSFSYDGFASVEEAKTFIKEVLLCGGL